LIPLELLSLDARYDDNELSYQVISIDFSKEKPLLQLIVHINAEEDIRQDTWEIAISGYRTGNISFEQYTEISCETEHALLLPFHDLQCELYFSGKVADVPALFVALYQAHSRIFNSYLPFEYFFNGGPDVTKILKASSGLLAKGPKEVMLSYASCLAKNKVSYSIIGEREVTHWNGHRHVKENLKILFLDNSYIIATDFDFTRL
jgi:hypothetical protein